MLNKVDKIRDKQVFLPVMDQLAKSWPGADIHPVSALTGDGVDSLLEAVIRLLPQGGAMYPEDQVSTLPVRFMAAEIVREKLFLALRQELPYSTAVGIEAWEESPDGDMVRIHAEIYVTRRNHKAMVIGQGGRNLKQIGIEARKDIEELLGQRVYLELFVKVREGWTEDAGFLRAMGLGV